MFGLGATELIIILVIILILFGGKKLPELSRSLAQGVKELRSGFDDSNTSADKTTDKTETETDTEQETTPQNKE